MNQKVEVATREASQVFWNYLFIFGGRFGAIILSTTVLAFVARTLRPEGLGKFSLFLMASNFVSLVFLNWPNSAIVRFGREEFVKKANISKVFAAAISILTVTFTISIILLLLFKSCIATYIGINKKYFLLLVFFILSSALYDLSFYVLQAVGKMKIYASLPLIEKIVTLFLFFLFLKFTSLELKEVIVCFLLGQLAVILVSFMLVEKQYFLTHFKVEKEYIYRIIRYAWSMSLGAISTFVTNWIDIIIIKKYLPLSEVGIYSLAYRGMTFFSLLVMSTISLTVPMIVSFRTLGKTDLIKQYLDNLIPQGIFFWSIFLSFIVTISNVVIPVIFGESYNSAILPFNILLVGIAFNSIGCFYSGFTSAFDIVAKVVGISVLISVLKTIGDFVFVPQIGILGAAIVSTGSIVFGNLLYIPIVNRSGKVISNKRRYLVNIWALPVIFTLIGSIIFSELYLRFLSFTFVTGAFLIAAKRYGLLKRETVVLIEKIEMPVIVKKAIIKFYDKLI